jgi:hypothetical protein
MRRVVVASVALVAGALDLPSSASGYSFGWSASGSGNGDPPVFDYTTDRCPPANSEDYPDLNVTAFRFRNATLGQNRVQLNFPGPGVQGRRLVGPDLDTVKREWELTGTEGVGSPPNCGVGGEIVYRAPRDNLADPASFTDWEWLGPPYYDASTGKVYVQAHNEFRGQNAGVPAGCASAAQSWWPSNCWFSSINLLVSDGTGGSTSNQVGGNYLHPGRNLYPSDSSHYFVATVPYAYWHDWGRVGYNEPSNTIKVGSYYYFMTLVTGPSRDPSGNPYTSAQKRGMCVVRTPDLADATAWRAWGGQAYNVPLVSPYSSPAPVPEDHVCEPVGPANLGGMVGRHLSYNTYLGKYMLVGTASTPDGLHGTYYSLSDDLVNWSDNQLLMKEDPATGGGCNDAGVAYATILDPADPAATANPLSPTANTNFDHPGRKPSLYFVRFNLDTATACGITSDRDLARMPIEFKQRIATLSNNLTEDPSTADDRGFDTTQQSYALGPVGCNPGPSCFADYDNDSTENSLFAWVIGRGQPEFGYGRIGQGNGGTGGMPLNWQNGDDVWYSAAFYLPTSFLTQNTYVDMMRWQTAPVGPTPAEGGGIALQGSDKLSLVRGNVPIGQEFTPPLGRWFSLEVHQKLGTSAGGGTLSEAFLDGRLVSSSSAANRSQSTPVLRVNYGLVGDILPTGNSSYLFADRASVTGGQLGPLIHSPSQPTANLVGVPKTPTGVRTGPVSGGSSTLSWNGPAVGDPVVNGYQIYQKQGDGTWDPAAVGTTTGNSISVTCPNTYRIGAFRNFSFTDNTGSPRGESIFSSSVSC